MVEYLTVATAIIPFMVGALKMVLKRFKIEVRSQTLVAVVCVVLGSIYAALNALAPQDILVELTAVATVSFVTSQALYKMWAEKKK